MNERIRELAEQAGAIEAKNITNIPRALSLNGEEIEKFAELFVQECGVALAPMLRDMISRGQAYELIRQHFGVEERKGWVCPKCGVDRTQDVCPKGDTAALTGECPMTGKALLRS